MESYQNQTHFFFRNAGMDCIVEKSDVFSLNELKYNNFIHVN